MPDFVKNLGTPTSPFGRNEFLRSTQDVKTIPAMISSESFPKSTIDGNPNQKVLQPGTVIARITSGPNAGLFGPFQAAGSAAAEVQTLTPSGTWSGTTGTYTVGDGTNTVEVPVASTATQLAALIDTLPGYAGFVVSATGGPMGTGAFTITFTGDDVDADVPQLTFAHTNIAGGTTPNAAVATTTAGVAGADDGRQTAANIIGLALTFLPWQLTERDVEIGVVYEAAVVQGWCIEYNAAGVPTPLSNTTAAYMQRGGAAGKTCDITFF